MTEPSSRRTLSCPQGQIGILMLTSSPTAQSWRKMAQCWSHSGAFSLLAKPLISSKISGKTAVLESSTGLITRYQSLPQYNRNSPCNFISFTPRSRSKPWNFGRFSPIFPKACKNGLNQRIRPPETTPEARFGLIRKPLQCLAKTGSPLPPGYHLPERPVEWALLAPRDMQETLIKWAFFEGR
jgi:hypothetical protein